MQMATTDRKTAGTEEELREKTLPPTEEEAPPVLNDISAPLNFSELTPCQFGISEQSFIPSSSSNRKSERTSLFLCLTAVSFTQPSTEVF